MYGVICGTSSGAEPRAPGAAPDQSGIGGRAAMAAEDTLPPVSATPDPHKPLRDDVRQLGELLGQAIRAREGDQRFALVERVRALAKAGRSGDASAFDA